MGNRTHKDMKPCRSTLHVVTAFGPFDDPWPTRPHLAGIGDFGVRAAAADPRRWSQRMTIRVASASISSERIHAFLRWLPVPPRALGEELPSGPMGEGRGL